MHAVLKTIVAPGRLVKEESNFLQNIVEMKELSKHFKDV